MAENNQTLALQFCEEPEVISKFGYVEKIDTFVIYDETFSYFRMVGKKEMSRKIHLYIANKVKKNITMSLVDDVIKQIKNFLMLRFEDVISPYLGLKDFMILDTTDFSIIPASSNIPCFHHIQLASTELNKDMEMPLFSNFLQEVLIDKKGNHDPKLHLLVQEIFGYILLPTLEAHASFFFVGKGGNGKSVVLDSLRAMMGGETFCDSKSIETLTTNQFAVADLLGKRLNICAEEESKFIKSDKFKALVAGDAVSVRRLYEQGFTWIPTVKYVYSTNQIPSFAGFNTGLLRRICIVPFHYEVTADKKDTSLSRRIMQSELGGITRWAIEGAKRLVANGYRFTVSEAVEKTKKEFEEQLSSAIQFFNDKFTTDSNRGSPEDVVKEHLYEEYVAWCVAKGKKSLNYYNFFQDLITGKKITDEQYESSSVPLIRIRAGYTTQSSV
jgi:P4 family phage/plasmid primase-like protien